MDQQYVVFELDQEQYGVKIGDVESIIKMQPITRIPHSPAFIEGVTTLRGKVLPVVDLRKRFGLQMRDVGQNGRIIVTGTGGTEIGMMVDGVSEVLTISDRTIEAAPAITTSIESAYITGIAKFEQRLIILLDLRRVFSLRENDTFQEMAQPA
jgi:purine-binding chemotaxis protein CheW